MKYKIEKNTVQETLILPLYSRKLCTELYPNLYRDETSVRLLDQIDYDFSEAEKNSRSLMQRFGALEVAMRQNDLAFEVRAYLKNHPYAAVVNLGCGLDNTGRACDNGRCKIYNLDFPDVIALRQQLLPAGEREQNIPCDLKDPAWFDKIDASGGAVFFASGVFYYFLTEQVRELVQKNNDRTATAALLSAVYRNGKNRCDRWCCQWTVLLSQGGAGSRHRTGTDRPQYDEPETKMLYDTVLYRDACCSCADYRFVERGFLFW